MKENYNRAKICPFHGAGSTVDLSTTHANYVSAFSTYCDLKLEPDLNQILEQSRNPDELRYVWAEWREKVGPPNKNTFMRYMDAVNRTVQSLGFRSVYEQISFLYDDPDFDMTLRDLWMRMQPLYKQLFTFVRRRLHNRYGDEVLRQDGPIPGHILGNMWSQNWKNIIDLLLPGSEIPDVTGEMVKQGYTPTKIFQTAEEFFTSIGIGPLLPEFWRSSILEKPHDSFTQCQSSAWDFCNFVDFRIKQCTSITLEDFVR